VASLSAGVTDNAHLLFPKRHNVIIYLNRHNPRSDGRGSNNIRRAEDGLKLLGGIGQHMIWPCLVIELARLLTSQRHLKIEYVAFQDKNTTNNTGGGS